MTFNGNIYAAHQEQLDGLTYEYLEYYSGVRYASLVGYYNTNLIPEDLTIPATVKFKKYYGYNCHISEIAPGALKGCTKLKSVNTYVVEDIKYNAFENCTSLQKVTLGVSCKKIESKAFTGCTALDTINYVSGVTIAEDAFDETTYQNAKLIVPDDYREECNNHEVWSKFQNKIYRYTISLSPTYGNVSYNGEIVNSGDFKTFSALEGSSIILSFTPDTGRELANLIINGEDVTSKVINNQYTIEKVSGAMEILISYYTITISAKGNGYIACKKEHSMYNVKDDYGETRNESDRYIIPEDDWHYLHFYIYPDEGHQVAKILKDGVDITAEDIIRKLEFSESTFPYSTKLEFTFEEIPPVTYKLSVKATGNGTVSYNGTNVREGENTFEVEEGNSPILTFTPDTGNKIKSVKLNDKDITSELTNNQYTISNISSDHKLEVEFEPIIHSLTIKATGCGSATFNSTEIRDKSSTFAVNEGTSATIAFNPDAGYRVKTVKLNDTNVTSSIVNGQYTISNISSDNALDVEFEKSTYMLNIKSTGNGTTIYNSTSIRNQGNSFTVDEGTTAVITFSPDAGYRIKSVIINGADVTAFVSNSHYTVSNISANTTVEVEYDAIPIVSYSLSISATGNGTITYNGTIIRGKSQAFTVDEGASATITIAADDGHVISSVKVNDVDVTSNIINNQYTISNISGNTTLKVVFEPITHSLSITASGNGSASYNSTAVRGKTQTFTVNEGTSAIVSFTPDAGYRIASVKVNNSDVTANVANNQYTISNITANTTLSVTFEAITHSLSITASGNGSAGFNSTTIRNKTEVFTINEGTSATVTFTPDAGYKIKSVKQNGTDVTSSVSESQYTISNISSDITLEVAFEAITHTLNITASGNGSATYNSTAVRDKTQTFIVNEGISATITLAPDAGHSIATVKLNGTDVTSSVTNNQYMISNITTNTTLEVSFEAITHMLSITASGNGSATYNSTSIRGKTQNFTVNEGSSATVTFSPDAGHSIASVKLNGTDITSSVSNNQYTISSISSDNTLEVKFEAITHILTVKATGYGTATYGETTIKGKSSSFTVTEGSSATITFVPDAGYRIKSVKFNDTDVTANLTNSQYTISNINSDNTLAVEFEAIPPTTYTLSITASGNGFAYFNNTTVRNKAEVFTVTEGTTAAITFTPDAGYRIANVRLNGTDVTSSVADNKYTISKIAVNTTLAVTFEAIPPTTYTLSITASGNGSVTYSNTAIRGMTQTFTVTEGTSATITFTPDAGYRIAGVKVNDADVTSSVSNNKHTINNITANTTLVVTFEAIPPTTYTLSIAVAGNGAAKFNNTTVRNKTEVFTVIEGSDATIDITPDTGYRIARVLWDDIDVTNDVVNNKYTISNISSNTTLAVEFEAIPPTTYSLSITAAGNGSATYNSTAVRGNTQTFTVNEGTSATITFTPDAGYRIACVKVNDKDVTSSVANNKYTISNITANTTLAVTFEAIPPTTYSLSITAIGNGIATYNNTAIRGKTQTFTITEGTSAAVTFTPDAGYRIKSVRLNNADVTSSVTNSQYTISNIKNDNALTVEFEAIPPSVYTMNIVAVGSGSVSYNNTTIRNQSKEFSVTEKSSVTITMSPDNGYRVASVKVNSVDVTNGVQDNQYTISNIAQNTNVEVAFEEMPPTTYSLTITAIGNGKVTYDNQDIRGGSSTFTVVEGSYATIQIAADEGYRLKSVTLDGKDVTADATTSSQYTTAKILGNTTLAVEFEEDIVELADNGVNYRVTSQEQLTANVTKGSYGLTLTIPATFEAKGKTWTVVGIDDDALAGATELAAIDWQPEALFTAQVSNPNLLLYVKGNEYAPATIQNVVVNSQADNIILTDAASGNNFYCPKAFTARRISYEHHYSMTTGLNTCQGWETIALPFDVTTVLNQKGVELLPYAAWQQGSNLRPFWLYQLTSNGWQAATAIQGNTPYIISMPNHEEYQQSYIQSGYIQYIGNNVEVKASSQLIDSQYGKRHLVANYQQQNEGADLYALNVNNLWSQNTDATQAEGSTFIRNSRVVHPFEAYMMLEGSTAAPRAIPIFVEETTGIGGEFRVESGERATAADRWYDLQGRKLQSEPKQKGIYIRNGKKVKY